MNSLFEIDGSRLITTGRTNEYLVAKHTYQFAIDDSHASYLKNIEKYVQKCATSKKELEITKYDGITNERNVELYDWFIKRLESNIYKNIFKTVIKILKNDRDNFMSLNINAQSIVLKEILKLFICDRQCPNLEKLNGKKTVGVIKFNATISKAKSVYLINQSVTGLYETKVDLLKE